MSITDLFRRKKSKKQTQKKTKADEKDDQKVKSQAVKDDDTKGKKGKKGKKKDASKVGQMLSQVDTSKLSFWQRRALGVFKKLPQRKQEEMIRQAMNPNEVQKHKADIEKQINEMVTSGQITKGQVAAVRSKLGLR